MSIRNASDEAVFQYHFRHLLLVGASLNWSTPPPFDTRAELISLHIQLDTSAVVANREMNLVLSDGSDTTLLGTSPIIQTASQTKYYIFAQNGAYYANNASDRIYIPVSSGIILKDGWAISSDLVNIQNGDTWRNRVEIYKVWIHER